MRIAVSMRVTAVPSYGEVRDALSHDWYPFLERISCTPILVPNALENPRGYLQKLGIEAVLLTGGNDVAPQLYGQSPVSPAGDYSSQRDDTEKALLNFAIDGALPVLGVCRGMQMINTYFGGSLIQDLGERLASPVNHRAGIHGITMVDERFERRLGARTVEVNSFHRDAVTADTLAPGLRPFALSHADGVVEGLYHPNLSLIGIQWHPERANSPAHLDETLFRGVLQQDRFWRS